MLDKGPIISRLVETLSSNPHVHGIVLGGSRGLGIATKSSDYDFVIWYEDEFPVTNQSVVGNLKTVVENIKPTRSVGRLSGTVDGAGFEFFYKSLTEVERRIHEAKQGTFYLEASQYSPQGRLNLELISFLVNYPILWERDSRLTRMKSYALPMPLALQDKMLDTSFRGAIVALSKAAKVTKIDMHITYLLSYCSLFIWHLEIALFAINDKYPILAKGTIEIIESLKIHPRSLRKREQEILKSCLAGNVKECLGGMQQLMHEVMSLAGVDRLIKLGVITR